MARLSLSGLARPDLRSRDCHRRLAGLLDDRRDDLIPIRFMQLMAAPLDLDDRSTGNSLGKSDAMLDRKYGILCAVDDEKGGPDLVQSALLRPAASQPRVVRHAREVSRTIIVTLDKPRRTLLVKRMRRTRDQT
jgi:hypothetical protein